MKKKNWPVKYFDTNQEPVSLSILSFSLAFFAGEVPALRSSCSKDDVENCLNDENDDGDDPDNPPLADVAWVGVHDLACNPRSHKAGYWSDTVCDSKKRASKVWGNVLGVDDPTAVESAHTAHANREHGEGEVHHQVGVAHEDHDH